MERKRKLSISKTAVVIGAVPLLVFAHKMGPDAGYSGVPGEPGNCTSCHIGSAVNSGGGSVTVTFPGGLNYTPGSKQHLVVTVADPAQRAWGFQLTARTASNTKTQAGTFSSTDVNTGLECAAAGNLSNESPLLPQGQQACPTGMALQYIEHTETGYNANRGKTGSATYEFDWMPPATDVGKIAIYVAGNAANGNGTEFGDHIYTNSYTLDAASGGPGPTSKVLNGASYQPGISPGSWVMIQGEGLANTTRLWSGSDIVDGNLPTSLVGVSVKINGKPAYVQYVSAGQVNVLSPADASTGPVSVVVTNNGVDVPIGQVNLQPFAPGFFQWGATPYAITTRFPDNAYVGNPSALSWSVAAKPGDTLLLWGTGFGPTNPSAPSGKVVTGAALATTLPTITVGGVNVQVLSVALTAGSVGLYQVAIKLPDSMPLGDQAVIASVGGFQSSTAAKLFLSQ